ncbi:PHA/PHB synthase family protein [Natronococcus wangiae]|uniref:PHA/PHB synthase family protein n=1 Tax=Natronococcus wangiae TaxID=3068275 RepID=UPI00273D8A92|nr:alpha/beta fold hydrolase [Natronococcus sp. AD5]
MNPSLLRAFGPFRSYRAIATDVGQTPHDVVYAENKLRLLHYEPLTEWQQDIPILLVSAIINKPYILDLQPERSVVRRFLEHGFDVYLVDWGAPSRFDSTLGIDDYVARYLENCVDDVLDHSTCDAIHLFGYCTGGTLSAIFAALYPQKVRTLGLLAPVLSFDANEGIFRLWGCEESYDLKRVVDVCGNAPGELLSLEFSLIAPFEYHLGCYLRLYDHLDDEEYVDHFARRLRWGFDSIDVPGELYRQFLVDLYRENKLLTGRLTVDGRLVDVANINLPVLNVIGSDDQFIPPEASLPFLDAISSEDTEVIDFPTDHVGLSVGEASHDSLWPRVCDWFEGRS